MSKIVAFFSVFLVVSESLVIPTRFRRQYGWGVSPYYNAAQYYETQPQQWSSQSQYQNNQNYYSPYFYGYQRQQNWQTSNQNTYQSQYNRPSWISENNNGYATAPPAYSGYNQANSGYGRPKYLATMKPKPTLSPVILERSTLFVTAEPMKTTETDSERHPTFLERLGVATLPVVPTITSSEEETMEKAEEELKSAEHEILGNGEMLPERPSDSVEEETRIVSSTTEESTSTEASVLEKDDIASSEFFASSTEGTEVETTTDATTTEAIKEETTTVGTMTTEETPTVGTTTAEETTSETTTSESTTTTEPSTTSASTESTTMTTTLPATITSKKDVKPVTLLAFQEVTDEVTSNAFNVTQPTVDQSTSVGDLNEIGEGSGSEAVATTEENTNRSTFSTGIVGLRAPPVPKTTDSENVGLAVVEWTDSDNEVRKALLTQ